MPKQTYFELTFNGPWKGINVSMPENLIDKTYSPSFLNYILKNGEIRTRPRQNFFMPGPPDNNPILVLTTFRDSNLVSHTIAITQTSLWQLNPLWRNNPKNAWNKVGQFPDLPGINIPVAYSVFLNQLYWTNGGTDLWNWDGIHSIGVPQNWKASTVFTQGARIIDSNGNVQIAVSQTGRSGTVEPTWNVTLGANTTDSTITWINNGAPAPSNAFNSIAVVDASVGTTAGAFFLGELNFHLLMLNTIEGKNGVGARYPQRVRWSPSGFPNVWDNNVNIGAGFNDEIDVPEEITGFLTIGRVGFIFRTNGITELTSISSGTNPWDFNHLWASNNGIGNVFPFSIAGYGPIGAFVADDDIYNLNVNGFKKIGGVARDAIFNDLAVMTGNPIASIIPKIARNYAYPVYKLTIPFGEGSKIWNYSFDDDSWQSDFKPFTLYTGRPETVATL